jgi:hypothetical protein
MDINTLISLYLYLYEGITEAMLPIQTNAAAIVTQAQLL